MAETTFNPNSFNVNWKEDSKSYNVKKHGKLLERGCPQCNSKFVKPTGKTYQGFRMYICMGCYSTICSPTEWAKCDKFGIIGVDWYIHDCLVCPVAKKEGIDVRKQQCPYFKGRVKLNKDEVNTDMKE